MERIEVWFTNGLFRAYPNVKPLTIKENEKEITFEFVGGHTIWLNKDNINFIERMDEE